MPDPESEDVSDRPPSMADIHEARAAVAKMIVTCMAKIPPELAVQLPNIHRCLGVLEDIVTMAKK